MKRHIRTIYITDKLWGDIDFLKSKFKLKSKNQTIEFAINRTLKF